MRVIEFAILFGLGFLTATLLMLMLAPAIHRRIVAFTEKRLFATMPISPEEVRAQKDMARAVYAAENARLRQELEDERSRSISLRVRHDQEVVYHKQMESGSVVLQAQAKSLTKDVETLQNDLESKKKANDELVSKLQISEEAAKERAEEIQVLSTKVHTIARQLDEVKVQLVTRELQFEQAQLRASSFKSERDNMSKQLIGAEAKNQDIANKVTYESRKVTLLEQQLARKAAQDADTENLLERRANEIARLKERLRTTATQVTGTTGSASALNKGAAKDNSDAMTENQSAEQITSEATGQFTSPEIEQIAARSAALSARLMNLQDKTQDEALREEIADLAAQMVAFTARQEGASSPILQMLNDNSNAASTSLSARAKRQLESAEA
jgi:chromosome segregation ATPase